MENSQELRCFFVFFDDQRKSIILAKTDPFYCMNIHLLFIYIFYIKKYIETNKYRVDYAVNGGNFLEGWEGL